MDESVIQDESQLQFFQFTTKQLKLETRIVIKDRVAGLVKKLIDALSKKDVIDLENVDVNVIKTTTTQNILTKMEPILNELDEKFEKYLFVPDNVLFFENFLHNKYTSTDDINSLEIESLQSEYLQLRLVAFKLKQEHKMYELLKETLQDENTIIEIMKKVLLESDLLNTEKNEELLLKKLARFNIK